LVVVIRRVLVHCQYRRMTRPVIEPQAYPIAPDVPLSLVSRLNALRVFHTGPGVIRDAGGPVAMVRLGPERLIPPFAVITSPQGACDVLGATDGAFDKENLVHVESRDWGDNVFNLPYEPWLKRRRALQPLFTKRHVASFAGHMAGAAEALTDGWIADRTVDLDRECRKLTLRVVGESIFGLDLGDRAQELGPPIRQALRWVTHRSTRPVRSPGWLPTPARHRFRSSLAAISARMPEALANGDAAAWMAPVAVRRLTGTITGSLRRTLPTCGSRSLTSRRRLRVATGEPKFPVAAAAGVKPIN